MLKFWHEVLSCSYSGRSPVLVLLLESAPAQRKLFFRTVGLEGDRHLEWKRSLHLVVAMSTRLISRLSVFAESETSYNTAIEHEYRNAEYEYDEGRKSEPLTIVETNYANTDFDLRAPKSFDVLNAELSEACCTLHYVEAEDGTWSASYEADRMNDSATNDILAFMEVLNRLTDAAKQELADCTTRDFNVGIHCWDTWAYNIGLPPSVIAAVANADCSISFTLYPMREPDGTPKIDEDDG